MSRYIGYDMDDIAGEWPCPCGAINLEEEVYCWSCGCNQDGAPANEEEDINEGTIDCDELGNVSEGS